MQRRVAIVDGLRTPFCKHGTALASADAIELGAAVVRALVERGAAVERVVFGHVVPTFATPNLAREIALTAGLAPTVDASTVSRACTTSYRATIDLAAAIAAGELDAGIAGGVDSTSTAPLAVTSALRDAFLAERRARSVVDRVRAFRHVGPRDLVPEPPSLVERATGLSMGEHAEEMAKTNQIARAAQDELALRSHRRAASAWADGRFADDVIAVHGVRADNLVRKQLDLAALAALPPVFDRAAGSVTAGNSSALTDGAAALALVAEDRLDGRTPLAFLRGHAFTALSPRDQLLMGPVHAIPRALAMAGVTFDDLDLLDLHEAFAAQVLSVMRVLPPLDDDRWNVGGGSIALGHPFAATGARQVLQTARELRRRGGGLACVSACAAGGLGAAIVIEVP